MNRRGFLAGLGALVGGLALEEAIPLGRVWSFPSQIVVPKYEELVGNGLGLCNYMNAVYYDKAALDALRACFKFSVVRKHEPKHARLDAYVQALDS